MPNRRSCPEVFVQARTVLEEARAEGLPFDLAWEWRVIGTPRKRARVRYGHQTAVRAFERAMLQEQREIWRAAFELRESSLSRGLELLLDLIADGVGNGMRDAPEFGGLRVRIATAQLPVPNGIALKVMKRRSSPTGQHARMSRAA